MRFVLDAQLPPQLATWLQSQFAVSASSVRDLGLRDSSDMQIFLACREVGSVIVTKDEDFLDIVAQLGLPPQVLLITCGNNESVSKRHL